MSTATTNRPEINLDSHRAKRREADWVTQVEDTSGASTLGRVANVSLGGLLVRTSTTFEPGTPVTIRFHMRLPSNSHYIESRGRVVHEQTGALMGIEFLQLQDSARRALSSYISQET